ncbi:MAG: hypothetical protein F6K09_29730, partial [Merismopedia sp. SIO2A8]|nr:hypothetical protein [Merismopedia sp. SIO2A8]
MAKPQTLSKKKKKSTKKKAKAKKGKKKQKANAAQPSKQEQRALKKKRDRAFKEFKQYLTKVVGIGVFLGIFAGLLAGDPKLSVVAVAGVIALSLSYKYPRKALWFFIIYMPFSGTVTYAIGNSPVLQLAKDGFYFPALWSLISYCRREKVPLAINQPVWT